MSTSVDPAVTTDQHDADAAHAASEVFGLPDVLDLTQAQGLRDGLAALMADGSLVLDAGAVERMSTPCIQVLLAAARTADAAHIRFSITNPSPAFRTALADLGLQADFSSWMS